LRGKINFDAKVDLDTPLDSESWILEFFVKSPKRALKFSKLYLFKAGIHLGAVVQTCNLSFSGGRDQEYHSLRIT
jgi:hypothetical protein